MPSVDNMVCLIILSSPLPFLSSSLCNASTDGATSCRSSLEGQIRLIISNLLYDIVQVIC